MLKYLNSSYSYSHAMPSTLLCSTSHEGFCSTLRLHSLHAIKTKPQTEQSISLLQLYLIYHFFSFRFPSLHCSIDFVIGFARTIFWVGLRSLPAVPAHVLALVAERYRSFWACGRPLGDGRAGYGIRYESCLKINILLNYAGLFKSLSCE